MSCPRPLLFNLFVVFALVAVRPSWATAQEAPSEEDTAEAPPEVEYDEATIEAVNLHFANGAKLYYDGKYDEAIAEFEAAHAKIPNAIFLYNISLAQTKKGELHASLETAEQADAFGGLAKNEQVANQARIAALRRVVHSESAAVEIASQPQPTTPEPLFRFSVFGWTGVGLAVAGIVGLGGVVFIDQGIADDVEAYKDAAESGDAVRYEELRDDIRPRQRAGRALFVVSSVALAAGAGLLVYDIVLRDDERDVALIPTPRGIAVVGRF